MTGTPQERLAAICLALPEASEKEAWGSPTFRVRERTFAMLRTDGDRPAVWLKASDGAREFLIEADPERFFHPPTMGPKGWIGVRLGDGLDRAEVATLARRARRMAAPKRLASTEPDG